MCAVCGLPTTHTSTLQTLGMITLVSFSITTFLGAWWILKTYQIRNRLTAWWKKLSEKDI